MLEELAPGMPTISRFPLLGSLEEHQVRILTKTKAEEITDTGVLVISRRGNKETIPADTVVMAVGFKSNQDLIEKLKGKVPELYAVGDCLKPRRILEAMQEGFEAALKI
jgi:thioredoxin reductase